MEIKLNYTLLYEDQDKIFDVISGFNNGFYLTGGTCLHRFYLNKRFSDDLDFFCNDNDLYREYSREFTISLKEKGYNIETLIDTRDFIRIKFNDHLKIDLVNDRVFRLGKTQTNEKGYKIDNVFNILANKITAIIGRDEPKDVFDIYAIAKSYNFSWTEIINYSLKKSVFEIDLLVDRLQSFPVVLFDKINTSELNFLNEAKLGIPAIVRDIINGFDNKI